jgi:hypothetical protein
MKEKLKKVELAYVAGIIDGEGSICVFEHYHKNSNGNRYQRMVLRLQVANTDIGLITWLVDLFGGVVAEKMRPQIAIGIWKPAYEWQSGYQNGARVLELVLPYLRVKRRQAELYLECAATMRHWGKGRGGGRGVPEVVVARRASIAHEIKELNRKGVRQHALEFRGRNAAHAESDER